MALLGVLVSVLVLTHATIALGAASPPDAPVTAQVDPYQPPDLTEVDLPGWAAPFEPLARLPLWAQAALVSAAVAGIVFVVPMVSRWIWGLGEGSEQTSRDAEQ